MAAIPQRASDEIAARSPSSSLSRRAFLLGVGGTATNAGVAGGQATEANGPNGRRPEPAGPAARSPVPAGRTLQVRVAPEQVPVEASASSQWSVRL